MTPQIERIADFIADYVHRNGYGPTYREIAAGLGYRSVSTVGHHISIGIRNGELQHKRNSPRTVRPTAHTERTVP